MIGKNTKGTTAQSMSLSFNKTHDTRLSTNPGQEDGKVARGKQNATNLTTNCLRDLKLNSPRNQQNRVNQSFQFGSHGVCKQVMGGDAANRTMSTGLTQSNEKPDLGDDDDEENNRNSSNIQFLDQSVAHESQKNHEKEAHHSKKWMQSHHQKNQLHQVYEEVQPGANIDNCQRINDQLPQNTDTDQYYEPEENLQDDSTFTLHELRDLLALQRDSIKELSGQNEDLERQLHENRLESVRKDAVITQLTIESHQKDGKIVQMEKSLLELAEVVDKMGNGQLFQELDQIDNEDNQQDQQNEDVDYEDEEDV